MPKLILCQIVKNESKIIERCLRSVVDKIDYWVICDTGSTDDTVERIEAFFKTKSIPGKVEHTTFENFSQARNEALSVASKAGEPGDYILLIDADMEVQGSIDKSHLTEPAYRLKQDDGKLVYWNTRLVRINAGAKYSGYTHEVLNVPDNGHPPGYVPLWIQDRGDGGSKSNKFKRDIELLKKALKEDSSDVRSMFYLAESLRNSGRPREAITHYNKRIHMGGWDEEVWYSYYARSLCYLSVGDTSNFVSSCLEAYAFRPARSESLYALAHYYRERGMNAAAAAICEIGLTIPRPNDILFVEEAVYDHGFLEEMSIVGFYCDEKKKLKAQQYCQQLTLHPKSETRELAKRNVIHYLKSATEIFGGGIKQIDLGEITGGWAQMNPSVAVVNGLRLGIVRSVNYEINEAGQYPTKDGSDIIKTKNYVASFDAQWNVLGAIPLVDATDVPKTSFPVEGFEDCRLFAVGDQLYASTTVRDRREDGVCEIAVLKLEHDHENNVMVAKEMDVVRDYNNQVHQKNWMPVAGREVPTFVYAMSPTIALERRESKTSEINVNVFGAYLGEMRGSSQVIPFKDGYLCVVHEVTWFPKRIYTHRFVYLDKKLEVRAVGFPFCFIQKGIEFCAGLALDGENLVLSFGFKDASAHVAIVSAEEVAKFVCV